MNSRTTYTARDARDGTRWDAVASGWVLALLTGIATSTILRWIYGLLTEPPVERGEFTAAIMVISLVSGFLSFSSGVISPPGWLATRAPGTEH